jgi:hypothetical protein
MVACWPIMAVGLLCLWASVISGYASRMIMKLVARVMAD